MFSAEGEWWAQADIPNDSVEMLRNPPERFSRYIDVIQEREANKLDAKGERSIRDLRLGWKNVCFKAVVVKKSEARAVTSRDGAPLLVCSVTLSDGTGEIPLSIWNNQIGTISEGDRVQVHDARVRSFRGQIQLSLKKTGRLTILDGAKKTPITGILSHLIAT
jgi:ssDNA-binding replication factor A large subunit